MAISLCLTGTIKYIKHDLVMILAGASCRIIQGFSQTLIMIPCLSMITIVHPNERIKYVGMVESTNAFGNMVGPCIGSISYSFFGFFYMFVFIGVLHIIFIPMIKLTKPHNIDQDNSEDLVLADN